MKSCWICCLKLKVEMICLIWITSLPITCTMESSWTKTILTMLMTSLAIVTKLRNLQNYPIQTVTWLNGCPYRGGRRDVYDSCTAAKCQCWSSRWQSNFTAYCTGAFPTSCFLLFEVRFEFSFLKLKWAVDSYGILNGSLQSWQFTCTHLHTGCVAA